MSWHPYGLCLSLGNYVEGTSRPSAKAFEHIKRTWLDDSIVCGGLVLLAQNRLDERRGALTRADPRRPSSTSKSLELRAA